MKEELRAAYTPGLTWWRSKDEEVQIRPLLEAACWFTPANIQKSVDFFGGRFNVTENTLLTGRKWFLASDNETNNQLEPELIAHGAVEYPFEAKFPTRSTSSLWAKKSNYAVKVGRINNF